MLFLALATKAAKPTVWEKLQAIPMSTWVNLLIVIAVLVMLVKLWRTLRDLNELAPWIAMILLGGSVVLYWTYERTEPKMLSPVMDFLSHYLPSKIQYKDASAPK